MKYCKDCGKKLFEKNYEGCVKNDIKTGIYVYIASRSIQDTDGEIKAVLDAFTQDIADDSAAIAALATRVQTLENA